MNSTSQLSDCIFWTRSHVNPEYYDSSSFNHLNKALVAIHCISFPISSLGNLLVLVAMVKTTTLHTTANIFIGSLAFSDFLIGAIMQPMMISVLSTRSLFIDCTFQDSLTFIGFLFTSTSATLMAAVSCERYMCLFLHMRYSTLITHKRAFLAVFLIWLYWVIDTAAFFLGGELFIAAQVFCGMAWTLSSVTITFCYLKILLLVRHHRRQIQSQQAATTTETVSQAKLAVTMGYVIWASIACYMPTTIVFQMFMFITKPNLHMFNAFFFTMAIQMMSSCLNPVIYCWRRHDIRSAANSVLRSFIS